MLLKNPSLTLVMLDPFLLYVNPKVQRESLQLSTGPMLNKSFIKKPTKIYE